MEYVYWLLSLLFCFDLVTVPLYFRILYVLAKDSKFKSPFFRLILLIGILDLSHYFIELSFYHLALIPPFLYWFASCPPSRWISAISASIFFLTYQQFFLHVAISANRMSGLLFPFKYKKWSRFWPHLFAVIFLVALGLCSDRLFCTGMFLPLVANDSSKGVIPSAINYDFYKFDQSLFTVYIGFICSFSCLIMNLATLIGIIKVRAKGGLQNSQQNGTRLEMNMFAVTLCMMAPQFILVAFHITLHLILNNQMFGQFMSTGQNASLAIYQMMMQMPWIDDIYSLSQPWILLTICSELRTAVLKPLIKSHSAESGVLFTIKVNQTTKVGPSRQ